MAPIGSVTTSIQLEKPQCESRHDPIRGTVSLAFRPKKSSTTELFGPLRLQIVLHGYLTINIAENRTSHAYVFFNDRRQLVGKKKDAFNGSIRISSTDPAKVSFELLFPDSSEEFYGRSNPPPPTFSSRVQTEALRQYGKHQGSANIDYSLSVEIDFPGLNVDVTNKTRMAIYYGQPSQMLYSIPTTSFSQALRTQTYQLLPEDERPTGIFDKTKAVITNRPKPTYTFEVLGSGFPGTLVSGQALHFRISVRPQFQASSATSQPDIFLSDGTIELVAKTTLYATNERGLHSPPLEGSKVIYTMVMQSQDPGGQFSKANDYSQMLKFDPLPTNIPLSFSVEKLSRFYRLRLELGFSVAGERVVMRKEVDVRILSCSATERVPEYVAVQAGPSQPRTSQQLSESLPSYGEAVR